MGRHGTDDAPQQPATRSDRVRAALRRIVERGLLGAVAGASTLLVLAWAGTRWRTAAIAGALTGACVLVAAWIATTIPDPGDAAPDEPRGPHETGRDGH